MAGRTIQDLPFALPVADPFTVCTINPVPCLMGMALTADHIGIIVVDLFPFQGNQTARDILVVAGHAPELALAMQAVPEF